MKPIHAVFENGVFRPTEPVHLPEQTLVLVEPQMGSTDGGAANTNGGPTSVTAILNARFASGHADTAARHNEHQP